MSDRTSHRRRARQNHAKQARAGIAQQLRDLDEKFGVTSHVQMCDKCDRGRFETQYGDLLLCWTCREAFPVLQPWRIDPESGEAIDTRTGKPFVFDDEAVEPMPTRHLRVVR
jgi:hypothetical protein